MSNKRRTRDQAGVASILFTMIMMIVISLIVLAFAQVARRGSEQALNNRLSSQAYYAAESGVNDAVYAISQLMAQGKTNLNNTGCALNADYTQALGAARNTNVNANNNVKYSCMRVDATPKSLTASAINAGESKIFNLQTAPGTVIGDIWIVWSPPEGNSGAIAGCPATATRTGDFTPVDTWASSCGHTPLKIELVPVGGDLTRNGIAERTMTFYAVPTRDNTAFNWGENSKIGYNEATGNLQGARVGASCVAGSNCNILIDSLPASLPDGPYALRITSLYSTATDISIHASRSFAEFINGQAVIDVTGKAQDVSRRIQVRVPLGGYGSDAAKYAIQTRESLCKHFSIGVTSFNDDAACIADIP